ncbi:MAG TPA: condensation domain-containing protein, partial [Blastocatellia bacterium]|nr:condensation domain-containing protein [Blastocatellia bacterium]
EFPLPIVDVSGLERQSLETTGRALNRALKRRLFNLQSPPVMRATLFRAPERELVLMIVIHHIALDDWSRAVFLRELDVLYDAYSSGRPSPLPELRIQYADYAIWQQEWLKGEARGLLSGFWKPYLAGAPGLLNLPTDRLRPPIQGHHCGTVVLRIPEAVAESVRELGRNRSASLFMTLLAAFNVLLFRYASQADISVGTYIANRHRAGTEALIGLFVNIIVIRTRLAGNTRLADVLEQTRSEAIQAYTNQELPFGVLLDEISAEKDKSHSPFFQVMLVLQNTPSLVWPSPSSVDNEDEEKSADFDLTLRLADSGMGEIRVLFEYNRDLFDHETVMRMSNHFRNVCEAFRSEPDRALSTLNVLTESEYHQVAVEWRDTSLSDRGSCSTPPRLRSISCYLNRTGQLKTVQQRDVSARHLLILDRSLHPVPIGVWGELFVICLSPMCGESHLEIGSVNNATEGSEPTMRLTAHSTNESARYLPDGRLESRGPIAREVDFNGRRVALLDIELALMMHRGVLDAGVAVVESDQHQLLAAYIVPVNEGVDLAELRDLLGRSMPSFMLPSRFLPVRSIPRTSDGMVEAKNPLAIAIEAEPVETVGTDGGVLEEDMIGLWSDLMGEE